MFILLAVTEYNSQNVICCSEDRNKLQEMVNAFYANTTDEGGVLKSLKIHPTEIVFGKFNLVRERHSNTYFCDSFSIPYDAFLKIKEVLLV